MRAEISMTKELRDKVRDWANENGFLMKRAYAELIRKGLGIKKHEKI